MKRVKPKIGTKTELKKLVEMIRQEIPGFRYVDMEVYEESLEILASKLHKEGGSINLGHTSAKPVGAKCWMTADGGKIIASLAALLEGWGDPWKDEALECVPEYMLEQLWIPGTHGQEDYELGKMRGDWS